MSPTPLGAVFTVLLLAGQLLKTIYVFSRFLTPSEATSPVNIMTTTVFEGGDYPSGS